MKTGSTNQMESLRVFGEFNEPDKFDAYQMEDAPETRGRGVDSVTDDACGDPAFAEVVRS